MILIAVIVALFWTLESFRSKILMFLIEIEDGTIEGYLILYLIGIIIIISGGPIAIYEIIIGYLLKNFWKAFFFSLPMIIVGYIMAFYISRWLF